ncbi:hypothetical protein [Dactylosporangium sp. NPDC048998]|uniref:hypothetical protein n=1 Tax=Dactylosporangium sp. NPDC048998 TaxID=3363976 RepID=UPI0037158FE6
MVTRESGFEERLLNELKAVVAERTQETGAVPARRGRRRLVVAGVTAGVAAVAVAATAAVESNSAAYAVERDPDGSVRVSIFDYRDPEGLRQRLASFGVRAAVNFLPAGQACREPRADYVPRDRMPLALVDFSPLGSDRSYFRVRPQYIGENQTFVYTVQVDKRRHEQRFAIRLANGPVAPCTPVPGDVVPSHR